MTPENRFKVPFVISVILLILVTAISIFLFLQNKKLSTNFQTTITPTLTPPQSSISPTNISANFTENWKTYTNRTYGFEVKYPSNWFVYIDKNDFGRDSVQIESTKRNPDNEWDDPEYALNIDIYKNPNETKELEHWLVNAKDSVIINGIIAKKVEDTGSVFLQKDDFIYTFHTFYRGDANKKILNDMIDSFKFISIISNNFNIPSDWKTYNSQKYGFTISYPSKINFMDSCGVGDIPDNHFCGTENDNWNPNFLIEPIIIKQSQRIINIPLTNLDKIEISTSDVINDIKKRLPSAGWKAINANLKIPKIVTIGFSKTEGTKYMEHWFFIKGQILYDVNFFYVNGEGFSDTQLQNQLTDLKNIFTTMQF